MTHEEAKKHIYGHIHRHKIGQWPHIHIGEALGLALQAVEKQIPKKPKMEAMEGFDPEVASHLVCPTCGNPVTNYWVRGAKPAHCQFCGQAIDWKEEGTKDESTST